MITISNITKKFGKLAALDDVSINCVSTECIALIGPNGSGKTTLIKSILGMVVPDKGTIQFNNKNIAHNWKYRKHIGYMPQIGKYPENMTIGQIFEMMKSIRNDETISLDEELINEFGLDKLLEKNGNLIHGTRQKVSASLAFLFNPDVLILDEPTAGLDPLVASEILKEKIRREKTKGKLILITSHILSELDDLVTHIIFMQDGN